LYGADVVILLINYAETYIIRGIEITTPNHHQHLFGLGDLGAKHIVFSENKNVISPEESENIAESFSITSTSITS